MKRSNKLFFTLAAVIAVTLTYQFAFTDNIQDFGSVLGKNDSSMEDISFEEFDDFLDSELDAELESIDDDIPDIEDDDSMEYEDELELELDDELEVEIESVETDLEIATAKKTVRTQSKIEKLFLLVPVEIETKQTVTDSGIVVKEEQTLLGKLLDLFSF